jgi:hypothetical protein
MLDERDDPTVSDDNVVTPPLAAKPRKSAPKTTKKAKAKKKEKRNTHASRPRQTIRYWIEGIETGKFKGSDLVLAITKVEEHEKEKAAKARAKKLASTKPAKPTWLRKVLAPVETVTAVTVEPDAFAQPALSADVEVPERMPVAASVDSPVETLSHEERVARLVEGLRNQPEPESWRDHFIPGIRN